jgi:hypothetical protein
VLQASNNVLQPDNVMLTATEDDVEDEDVSRDLEKMFEVMTKAVFEDLFASCCLAQTKLRNCGVDLTEALRQQPKGIFFSIPLYFT